jgi:hypothetical protein
MTDQVRVTYGGQSLRASLVAGNLGIDQTTPGTTNAVVATGPAANGAPAVGNPIYVGGRVDTTATGPTSEVLGDAMALWLTARGAVVIGGISSPSTGTSASWANQAAVSLPNGAAGYLSTFPYKSNGTSMDFDRKPNATSRIASAAASTNATSAKALSGDLHVVNGNNAAGALRYLKFYNKASAPTVGTDVPVITLALPTGAFSFNLNGHYFSTGIAYALTTGAVDADTGALTAADILGLTITYA